jgi:hypothetical protein
MILPLVVTGKLLLMIPPVVTGRVLLMILPLVVTGKLLLMIPPVVTGRVLVLMVVVYCNETAVIGEISLTDVLFVCVIELVVSKDGLEDVFVS